MSFKMTGLDKVLREIEERFAGARALAIKDKALKAGAEAFRKELISQLETFKDTGETIKEVRFSEPEWSGKDRIIKVYWRGPHNRYSIIHLNEFGTIKNPNPRGKGKIALALRNSEAAYKRAVREELKNI